MKFIQYFHFVLILTICLGSKTLAQTDEIKINYSNPDGSFQDFVKAIENSKGLHFFYNLPWVDSLKVPGNYHQVSLTKVLDDILIQAKLHYVIDKQGNIVLTKEIAINPSLSENIIESEISYSNIESISNNGYSINAKYSESGGDARFEEVTIGEQSSNAVGIATITGYIKDLETGEPITGATIYIDELKVGTTTDFEGYYILAFKNGVYNLSFRAFGMGTQQKLITVNSDGQLNVNLEKELLALKEVVIKEERYSNLRGTQIGLEKLSMKEIKELPLAVGESDLLKATLMLPGIQSVGESAAGYNVRGGSADQNLFIINSVPVYNTSHMFGFFSTFNTDAIKDFKLFKSNIPVEYGGRISSVFDIRSKQGNKKEFSMRGGISPVTAKLLLEGPIKKDKSSYMIGMRSTYSNWILRQIENPEVNKSNVYFNDITTNISNEIDERNQVNLFGYFSIDNYKLATNISYNYYNLGSSLNWKHIYGKRLFSNTTAVYSNYHLEVNDEHQAEYAYQFKHNVKYHEISQFYTYLPSLKHEIKFGFNTMLHIIDPGTYNPTGRESIKKDKTFETERALESGIYIGDRFDVSQKFSIEGGLRFNMYNYLGPKTIFTYTENEPLAERSVIDTTYFTNHKAIKTYSGLDIRFSFRYMINNKNSIKMGYSRINQYLFILTNTVSISPTDRWKLCDPFAKPILGDQYNFGYYRNFNKTDFEASIEIYYKENKNTPDFKNGADLLKNQNIEREILSGFGRNYGIEFMIKKNSGKFTGWANYSYTRSELKFPVKGITETINRGNFYPSNYDKPHNVNFVSNYRANRRLSFSTNFTYSTGRPYTPPISKYVLNGYTMINFSDRNAERIPDYIRLDVSINLEGNLNRKKLAHSYWMLSLYNVTGRKNAYSVFFDGENGQIKGHMISIYSAPVFTLSYNFKLGNYASN